MNTLELERLQRLSFFKAVYEETNGDENSLISMWDIGNQLNIDRATTSKITHFLINEGLIAQRALGGTIGITHKGIIEITGPLFQTMQSIITSPQVNIVNINQVANAQIQQGSLNSSQRQSIQSIDFDKLGQCIAELEQKIGEIHLSTDAEIKELTVAIQSIKGQLSLQRPNTSVIDEGLKTLRSILEGTSGSLVAYFLTKLCGF